MERAVSVGLCYRCEHRAMFHESGARPRHECGEDRAVGGCYMYKPVRPVVVTVDDGEKRPAFASPMIAGRVRYDRVVDDMVLMLREVDDDKIVAYWSEL